MITIKEAPGHNFQTKEEMVSFLKANKKEIVALKKGQPMKITDVLSIKTELLSKKGADKAEALVNDNNNDIKVKIILNTTNYLDSHNDVHIKGLWNRTLNNTKVFYHLQEHKRDFDKVISTDVTAYVEEIPFVNLGVQSSLTTQALIYESVISIDRNSEMYKQYKNGWVDNHSVGMVYKDIELAIWDEEDEKEIDFWNKYIVEIANREDAEEKGYFWVVKEAELKEGSAVVFGSNPITPTLDIEENKGRSSTDTDQTKDGPSLDTHPQIFINTI